MRGINKVILVGNVGKDPEIRETANGIKVANLSLATNFGTGDKEKTEWHRLVFWDKKAETVDQYVRKGSALFVEGRIETRTYEKDGITRYSTEIKVYDFVMLGGDRPGAETVEDEELPAPIAFEAEAELPF